MRGMHATESRRVRGAYSHLDDHQLYQGAVQCVDVDLDFAARVFRTATKRDLESLREDFCGTALLSCEWVKRGGDRSAIGVDLDRDVLAFGRQHNLARLGALAKRVKLLEQDVRAQVARRVDAVLALNFSYWIFKQRAGLIEYFASVRRGLKNDGILVLDAFGGTESMGAFVDRKIIPAQVLPDGTRLPRFKYIWDQKSFNPIDHAFPCAIHFEMPDGTKRKDAFRYDWRFWTLPELTDALKDAGFHRTEVYADGWNWKKNEPDGRYALRQRIPHDACFVVYVVGFKS